VVSIGIIRGTLELKDEFTTQLLSAENKLGSFSKSLEKIGATAKLVGAGMTAAISVPLAGIAVAATKTFMEFETAMKGVKAALEPTEETFKSLEAAALEWGMKTQFSATQAAQALGELGKAGLTAEQSITALPSVLDMATVSGMNLAEAATLTADTMVQFNLAAEDTAHINDVLTKAAQSSTVDIRQLGESLKFVGPVAAGLGVSLEDTSAALAAFGNAGIKADMAGTALRNILTDIVAPTKAMRDTMEKLGIDTLKSADGTLKLVTVIDKLRAAGATAGDVMKMFGDRAGPAMVAMVSKGSEALVELEKKTNNAAGASKRAAEVMMEGLGGAMERLKGAAETAGISIGSVLAPAVTVTANVLEKFAGFISSTLVPAFQMLPTSVQAVIGVLGLLAAATGPVLFAFGALITTMRTVGGTQVAGAVIAAFTTLGNTIPVLTARVWLLDAAQKASTATAYAWGAAQAQGQVALLGLLGKIGLVAGAVYGTVESIKEATTANSALEASWKAQLTPIGTFIAAFRQLKLLFTDTEAAWKQMTSGFRANPIPTPDIPGAPSQFGTGGARKAQEAVLGAEAAARIREFLKPTEDYVAILGKVKEQYDRLTPSTRAQIVAAKELSNEAYKQVIEKLGIYEKTADMVVSANSKLEKSTEKVSDQLKKLRDAAIGLDEIKQTLDFSKALNGTDLKMLDSKAVDDYLSKLNSAIEIVGRLGLKTADVTQDQVKAWTKTAIALKSVADHAQLAKGKNDQFIAAFVAGTVKAEDKSDEFMKTYKELTKELERGRTLMSDRRATEGMSEGFQKLAEEARKASFQLEDMAAEIQKMPDGPLRDLKQGLLEIKQVEFADELFGMLTKTKEFQQTMFALATLMPTVAAPFLDVAAAMDEMGEGAEKAGKELKKIRKEVIEDFAEGLAGTLTDIAKGKNATEAWIDFGRSMGGAISEGVGQTISTSIGGTGGMLAGVAASFFVGTAINAAMAYFAQEAAVPARNAQADMNRMEILDQFGGERQFRRQAELARVPLRMVEGFLSDGDRNDPEAQAIVWTKIVAILEEYKQQLEGLGVAMQGVSNIATSMRNEMERSVEAQDKPFIAAQEAMIESMKKAGATQDEIAAKQAQFAEENANRVYVATESQIEQFNRLGTIAGGTIANIVGRTGDLVGAFLSAGDSIQTLIDMQETFGLTGESVNAATQQVIAFYSAIKNNEDAFTAIQGVGQVLQGFADSQIQMTSEMFNALGEELEAQALVLESRGIAVTDIYAMMAPQLQELWEQAQTGKVTIDETTQALLDQAEAQGVVGEGMRSINEQILGVLTEIKDMFAESIPRSLEITGTAVERSSAQQRAALNGVANTARETGNAIAESTENSQERVGNAVERTSDKIKGSVENFSHYTDEQIQEFLRNWEVAQDDRYHHFQRTTQDIETNHSDMVEWMSQNSGEMLRDWQQTQDERRRAFQRTTRDIETDHSGLEEWMEQHPLPVDFDLGEFELPDFGTLTVPVEFEMPEGRSPWDEAQPDVPGYKYGTDGYENFGKGTLAMLHGWEKVTPRGAQEEMGRGRQTIIIEVDKEPWVRVAAENIPDYTRIRAGSAVPVNG
jgi:TP901 family phage tail tape measure protein